MLRLIQKLGDFNAQLLNLHSPFSYFIFLSQQLIVFGVAQGNLQSDRILFNLTVLGNKSRMLLLQKKKLFCELEQSTVFFRQFLRVISNYKVQLMGFVFFLFDLFPFY